MYRYVSLAIQLDISYYTDLNDQTVQFLMIIIHLLAHYLNVKLTYR